jgi:GntR family transcriptional repressor for pyruvate dehydrogenase complex
VQKLERASLVDQAIKALIKYINSDAINVGDKMPSDAALCAEYDISRTTMREALRFLQALGYLEVFHNKGAFVLNKNVATKSDSRHWMVSHAQEVLDVMAVRSVLEPLAAFLAAEEAKQEEKYAIMGLKNLFEEVAKQGDHAAMSMYDEKFHTAIFAASQNTFLGSINEQISEALRNFRGRTFALDPKGELAIGTHAKIAEAILAGHPKLAEKYMHEHMATNIEIMKKYLKRKAEKE